jgi:hypothetical protein
MPSDVRTQDKLASHTHFFLVRTGEPLAVHFYNCPGVRPWISACLGVAVIKGASFDGQKIITRSPPDAVDKRRMFTQWRVWYGTEVGHASSVAKTLPQRNPQTEMPTRSTRSTNDELEELYTLPEALPASLPSKVSTDGTWVADIPHVFMDQRLVTRFYKCHGAGHTSGTHPSRFGVLVAYGPGFGIQRSSRNIHPREGHLVGLRSGEFGEGLERGYAGAEWTIRRTTKGDDPSVMRKERLWRRWRR